MTATWPEDPVVRRATAMWGQLLDEELIAVGGGEVTGMDWPDDSLIATTLAEWGGIADSTVDDAAANEDPVLDPTIAWLGGAYLDREPQADALRQGRIVGEPIVSVAAGPARKHKIARPGQQAMVTGSTVLPSTAARSRQPGRSRSSSRDWGQMALAAAAAAAVLLVGRQALTTAPRDSGQTLSVRPAAGGAPMIPGPQIPGGGAPAPPVSSPDRPSDRAADQPSAAGQPAAPLHSSSPSAPSRGGNNTGGVNRAGASGPATGGTMDVTTPLCSAPLSPAGSSTTEKSASPVLAVGPPRFTTANAATTTTSTVANSPATAAVQAPLVPAPCSSK